MTAKETLTAGGIASREFINNIQSQTDLERPDLAQVIPEACLGCSAAWNEAEHWRSKKLSTCPGRTESEVEIKETIDGEEVVRRYIVGRCHLGSHQRDQA